jgi:hypothetical protein
VIDWKKTGKETIYKNCPNVITPRYQQFDTLVWQSSPSLMYTASNQEMHVCMLAACCVLSVPICSLESSLWCHWRDRHSVTETLKYCLLHKYIAWCISVRGRALDAAAIEAQALCTSRVCIANAYFVSERLHQGECIIILGTRARFLHLQHLHSSLSLSEMELKVSAFFLTRWLFFSFTIYTCATECCASCVRLLMHAALFWAGNWWQTKRVLFGLRSLNYFIDNVPVVVNM